jgi:hypothetical protein
MCILFGYSRLKKQVNRLEFIYFMIHSASSEEFKCQFYLSMQFSKQV